MYEKFTPVLILFRDLVVLFDSNQEALRKVKQVVQVQEDGMYRVTRQSSTFFQLFFQRLQV